MKKKRLIFVIQKHFAKNLHYDLRLQIGKKLKSWAIPKSIPKRAGIKRLAIQTTDHALSYASFSGTIPEGYYGAGKVEIWDKGTYSSMMINDKGTTLSLRKGLQNGKIVVKLFGKTLQGVYALIHYKENQWLFFKCKQRKTS